MVIDLSACDNAQKSTQFSYANHCDVFLFLHSCIRAQLQRGVHVVTHVVHAPFEMQRIFNVLPRLNWYFNWFFCDHWLILLAICLSSGFLFYSLAIDGVFFSYIWCGKAMDNCNIRWSVVSYRSFGISMFTSSFVP